MTDPAGGLWQTSYTALDQVADAIDPLGQTIHYDYDALNRLIQVTDPAGGIQVYGYDLAGNRTSTTDEIGRTTHYAFDAVNQLTSITDPLGGATSYTYDDEGNQTGIIDPDGNLTQFVYDEADRLIEQIDPLGYSSFFVYDPVGNLTQVTDRNGRDRTFGYDALDRLTSEIWLDGMTVVNSFAFQYDAVGNLLSAADNYSRYVYAYDALDRVTSSDNAGTPDLPHLILNFAYDAVGNLVSVADNSGVQVVSSYDERDLLVSRSWFGSGIDSARVDFDYNIRGDQTETRRFADLAGTQQIGRSAFDYDAKGRLIDIVHRDALDAVFANYDYYFDAADQLVSETHHGQTSTYIHDLAGQLTDADHSAQVDEGYSYDANGNPTDPGIVLGPNNQILADAVFDYSYDHEGNLVQKVERASGEVTAYSYDHRNRLTAVERRSAGGIILHSEEYRYDVFDRRITVTVDGVSRFTGYDGDHAWADYDAAGNVLARYLFGDGTDEIIARFRPGDGTAWYLTDHLGTVRDLVDAAGQLINHLDYNSFGQIIAQSNALFGDRFTYTGREWDPGTGLYYYRARYYDPVLKRFLSQDPLGFAAGDANLYRYVGNNPLGATDPSGMLAAMEWLIVKQAAMITAGAAFETSCHLLEAWAQDELNDPWGTANQGFWQGVIFGLRNFALSLAIHGTVDVLARTSTLVGKAFCWLGPYGSLFATTAAHMAVVYQLYTEMTGILEAGIRGMRTGDYRLLEVRVACASVRLAQTIIQFRMSLPGRTTCGSGVTSAILAGLGHVGLLEVCLSILDPGFIGGQQRPQLLVEIGGRARCRSWKETVRRRTI